MYQEEGKHAGHPVLMLGAGGRGGRGTLEEEMRDIPDTCPSSFGCLPHGPDKLPIETHEAEGAGDQPRAGRLGTACLCAFDGRRAEGGLI